MVAGIAGRESPMKLARTTLAVASLLLLASTAFAAGKGDTWFSVQLANGTADLYDPTGTGYLSAYDHSELGVQVELWHFMSSDYAMTVSGGLGFFSETDKPGPGAGTGAPDLKYSQNSWNVRVGGDRVVPLGERATVFFGPGIEIWSGMAKFEDTSTLETQNVMRISLSSRIGMSMKVADNVDLGCHIGRKLGRASVTDLGREATWWPSSMDASGGLIFRFGGK
jgi:opacity protein-like surface antigen